MMAGVGGRRPAAEYPLTAAEYFAGIGLFRMGLERTGRPVAYANERNETYSPAGGSNSSTANSKSGRATGLTLSPRRRMACRA